MQIILKLIIPHSRNPDRNEKYYHISLLDALKYYLIYLEISVQSYAFFKQYVDVL